MWPIGVYHFEMARMADTQYLKQRRQGWYFVLAVPRDVQEAYGMPRIVETLRTRDLTVAQRLRWERRAHFESVFERLRGRQRLTQEDINGITREEYQETLLTMGENGAGHAEDDAEPTALEAGAMATVGVLEDLDGDHGRQRRQYVLASGNYRQQEARVIEVACQHGFLVDTGSDWSAPLEWSSLNVSA